MLNKCQSRTRNGSECKATAQAGKDVCVFHDPEQAAIVRQARRAGGVKRSSRTRVLPADTPDVVLKNASDISGLLTDSINQLRRGQLDARIANGIGYLASIQLRSFEQCSTEKRLSMLEASLGLVRAAALSSDSEVEDRGDNHGDN